MTFGQVVVVAYVAVLLIMSLVAFILYAKDKKMAEKNTEKRIKEKVLLGFAAFGGAIGSFLGRLAFRHKTQKIYFSIVIWFSMILQVAVLVLGIVSLFF